LVLVAAGPHVVLGVRGDSFAWTDCDRMARRRRIGESKDAGIAVGADLLWWLGAGYSLGRSTA
jgi:hypothetical protein